MGTEKVICDTDVMIDYYDQNNPRHLSARETLDQQIGLQNAVISAITKMEMLVGACNKKELLQIERSLHRFNILSLNASITEIAINLIKEYNLSHGLELPDSLIAASALYTECSLFTYNLKDYRYIKGLKIYKI